jgi:hypothetical protein
MSENPMFQEMKNALDDGRTYDAGMILAQIIMEDIENFDDLDTHEIDDFVDGFQGELG